MTSPNTANDGRSFIQPSQKDQFLRDGFICLDNVISQTELDWYRERYDTLFADESKLKQLAGKDEKGRSALPQILRPSESMPELREQPYFQRLGEIAKMIMGPEATYRNDHMIFKPAGYGVATPWHQDQAYHAPDKYYTNINFWMPLDGATVEGGCMQYVRRSHSGTLVPHKFLISGDNNSALVADNQDYWSANATAVPCPSGSICLHHSYCLHYAGPNRSQQPRRAYIVVYGVPTKPLDHPMTLPWLSDPHWPNKPIQSTTAN